MKNVFKRLGVALLAFGLLFYVGYQGFQVFYSNVTVETVEKYQVYETVGTTVIAIRNEAVITADTRDNHVFYTVQNGTRVAKGGTVAKLYSDEQSAGVQQKIEVLDEDIAQLNSVISLAENNYTSLDAINQQLRTTVQEVCGVSAGNSSESLRSLHSELLTLMNKRQTVIGNSPDFSESMARLQEEKTALQAQATAAVGAVTAPQAGYFIDCVDGYESLFPTDEEAIAALSAEQIRAAIEDGPPDTATAAVGKVARDFTWYLACLVPNTTAASLEEGGRLKVQLPFVSATPVESTVLAIQRGEGEQSALILKCAQMSEELASIRIQPAQLLLREHSGLRIPDAALRFNSENRAGAYVRLGTTVTFRYVDVIYHNDKDGYSICKIPGETDSEGNKVNLSEYVQLYDDIIVEGKNLYDGKIVRS